LRAAYAQRGAGFSDGFFDAHFKKARRTWGKYRGWKMDDRGWREQERITAEDAEVAEKEMRL